MVWSSLEDSLLLTRTQVGTRSVTPYATLSTSFTKMRRAAAAALDMASLTKNFHFPGDSMRELLVDFNKLNKPVVRTFLPPLF